MSDHAQPQQTALGRQLSDIIWTAAAKLELGPNWHVAAADTIEQLPTIRGLMREHELVDTLRARHVERRWSVDSTSSACGGCGNAWPCPDALALGVAR